MALATMSPFQFVRAFAVVTLFFSAIIAEERALRYVCLVGITGVLLI